MFLSSGCEDSEVRSLIPNGSSPVPHSLRGGWHSVSVEWPAGILMGSSLSSSEWVLAQLDMRLGTRLGAHDVGRGLPEVINSFVLIPSKMFP
jgi:hypothetical protein